MAAKTLIIHMSDTMAVRVEEQLVAAGCEIFRAETIDAATELLHQQPDVLLLDMQLAESAAPEQLKSLANQLELAEVFCLRLSPIGADQELWHQLAPFACGTVPAPGTSQQILEQVNTLLRIKQAEAERNQAQERLLLHRMEVSEGLRSAAQIQHALLPNHVIDNPACSFAWQFIP